MSDADYREAARRLRAARRAVVFTGAGISLESGIPTFRGPEGLWRRYDPDILEIHRFLRQPEECWRVIKEIFYDFFGQAVPNPAHFAVAEFERLGLVRTVITQNIDGLHQAAGSRRVLEFHGSSRSLSCLGCGTVQPARPEALAQLPPRCRCGGILKPDFVFFGEGIPAGVSEASFAAAEAADVLLVVGTTGEVMPACRIPYEARRHGAFIIEVNPEPSLFTPEITDIHLAEKAGRALETLRTIVISGGE